MNMHKFFGLKEKPPVIPASPVMVEVGKAKVNIEFMDKDMPDQHVEFIGWQHRYTETWVFTKNAEDLFFHWQQFNVKYGSILCADGDVIPLHKVKKVNV